MAGSLLRESPASAILSPLALLTPLFGVGNYLWELRFAKYWGDRLALKPVRNLIPVQQRPPI